MHAPSDGNLHGAASSLHKTRREFTIPLEMDRHNRTFTVLGMVWEDGEQEEDASSGFPFRRVSVYMGVGEVWITGEIASVYADGNAGCFFYGPMSGRLPGDVLRNKDGDQCRGLLIRIDRRSRDVSPTVIIMLRKLGKGWCDYYMPMKNV